MKKNFFWVPNREPNWHTPVRQWVHLPPPRDFLHPTALTYGQKIPFAGECDLPPDANFPHRFFVEKDLPSI